MDMEKSAFAHAIDFPEKQIRWLEMNRLEKADGPSSFPALTQIEVYGREADA